VPGVSLEYLCSTTMNDSSKLFHDSELYIVSRNYSIARTGYVCTVLRLEGVAPTVPRTVTYFGPHR
jgi:hypothetical protein